MGHHSNKGNFPSKSVLAAEEAPGVQGSNPDLPNLPGSLIFHHFCCQDFTKSLVLVIAAQPQSQQSSPSFSSPALTLDHGIPVFMEPPFNNYHAVTLVGFLTSY